ncbi:MAG: substrate-binding domain-containing protein [Clostridia bacterium]|nr:substrate-binding domain-containing protein [Clostridia bacterium]
MEENIIITKKHLSLPVKIILFVFYSALYILPLIFGFCAESIVSELCLKLNLGYEHGIGATLTVAAFIVVILTGLLILLITEITFYKKTDIPDFFFVLSPLFLVVFTVADFIYLLDFKGSYYANDNGILIFYIAASGTIKAVADGVRLLKNKSFRLLPLCLVSVFLCCSCSFVCEWYESFVYANKIGEGDRTSSWDSINQLVDRDASWQEIVTDTEFTLGQITEKITDYGEKEYYCDKGSYPNIDGSTVCVPMAVEFARQHLNFDDHQSRNLTSFSTTHWAYMNLIDKTDCGQVGFIYDPSFLNVTLGSVDLVIATHPSEEELRSAKEKGVELILKPVCYDAFVFITHKDNPVESLTVQQIKDIYSGKIKNWKEVGGKNEKIRAFQREANSGSQTAMERLVMGGTNMIDPIEVTVIEGMGELVEAVAEYENETASLGYTYRYYIDNLYKNDEIKTIAVEGILPTDENIRSGAYPYTTNYYGVIRKQDENNTGGKFLSWMLSEEGQKCIAQAGYISIE